MLPQGQDGVLDANESTSAPDGRGDISAFKETNRTETGTGGMMHAHDYWSGETRKVIWQQDIGLIPFPLMPEGMRGMGMRPLSNWEMTLRVSPPQ